MRCKYCDTSFTGEDLDGTFEEGFCDKFHRMYYEKRNNVNINDGIPFRVLKDTKYRDANGERIWFPKDGKPYYDPALRETIHSIKHKHRVMAERNLVMDGSSLPKKIPIEAGDFRSRSYRKALRIED